NADIARLNSQPERQGLEPIRVRSGLNSGEIIVKRISDDLLLELDAIGATVALASRMERLAGPGTILKTAATLPLAGRKIRGGRPRQDRRAWCGRAGRSVLPRGAAPGAGSVPPSHQRSRNHIRRPCA